MTWILAGVVIIVAVIAAFSLKNTSTKPETFQNRKNLPPTTEPIKGVPNKVNEFLNSFDIKKYEDVGMKINKGDNPPNVEGTYSLDQNTVFYDDPNWKNLAKKGDPRVNYTSFMDKRMMVV